VTDSSIIHAIGDLRDVLGEQEDGSQYIETLPRRGYRFVAAIERVPPRRPVAALDTLLAPYRAFVDGRAALEGLNRDAIEQARDAFTEAMAAAPASPAPHIGLANALLLLFESTRTEAQPDVTSLRDAMQHSRHACELDPSSADAWGTMAVVSGRCGNTRDAIAAARRAISLAPNDWLHHLRLASVSYGRQRLEAAEAVLAECPGLAFAHWFAATVYVARQSFDRAIEHLRAGCVAQDAQRGDAGRFRTVGLHFLHGLVLAARGDVDVALDELARELTAHDPGHVYARECAANTWYACGALHLRQERADDAVEAFKRALGHRPGHLPAAVALAALSRSGQMPTVPDGAGSFDAVMVKTVILALGEKHEAAARLCVDTLGREQPGSAGWLLPVEPVLNVTARRDIWADALALLRNRAL